MYIAKERSDKISNLDNTNNISNTNDILNFALQNGMIDLSYVQDKMEMSKRQNLLKKHQYNIWQASDGYWKTYIPDETKEQKRKLVKKKELKDLEEIVIAYVKEEEIKEEKSEINLYDLFLEWIQYKESHTNSSSYIKRITLDWEKFYMPHKEFISKPICKFTKIELDVWAHDLIKSKQLTRKQYFNMSIILRQSLDYAVEQGYVDSNVFSEVKINTKMFRKTKKKQSDTQVYLVDEVQKMVSDMVALFQKTPDDTAPLAILLDFEIGVRVGELLAIKTTDISPDWSSVHIQRQVVSVYEKKDDDQYKMVLSGFKVVEYTKSDNGDREVYLTEIAKKLIRLIIYTNEKYGYYCEDFLFVKGDKRIGYNSIQSRIVNGCKRIGIITKSCHKIRKTYISALIDSDLNIDEIRRQAGHSDERTTYGNYCYNRLDVASTQKKINDALRYETMLEFTDDTNLGQRFPLIEIMP